VAGGANPSVPSTFHPRIRIGTVRRLASSGTSSSTNCLNGPGKHSGMITNPSVMPRLNILTVVRDVGRHSQDQALVGWPPHIRRAAGWGPASPSRRSANPGPARPAETASCHNTCGRTRPARQDYRSGRNSRGECQYPTTACSHDAISPSLKDFTHPSGFREGLWPNTPCEKFLVAAAPAPLRDRTARVRLGGRSA
jgi:hypothetical protein